MHCKKIIIQQKMLQINLYTELANCFSYRKDSYTKRKDGLPQ